MTIKVGKNERWVRVGTTYERYKSALERIADGVEDPQAFAAAVLVPQKGEPHYRWKREAEERKERAEAKRQARRQYCEALYLEWLEAGRPTVAQFARDKGKSRTSTERALKRHERTVSWERAHLRQAELERSRRLRESRQKKWQEQNKEHWLRIRYFDREESAEALAAELGWTMEQMRAFIEASRMDKWVTTTEYNLHMKELVAKYGPKT